MNKKGQDSKESCPFSIYRTKIKKNKIVRQFNEEI
jgi:hypothetical protein